MGWDQQKCPLPSWARHVCRRGGLRAADSASKQGGAAHQPPQRAAAHEECGWQNGMLWTWAGRAQPRGAFGRWPESPTPGSGVKVLFTGMSRAPRRKLSTAAGLLFLCLDTAPPVYWLGHLEPVPLVCPRSRFWVLESPLPAGFYDLGPKSNLLLINPLRNSSPEPRGHQAPGPAGGAGPTQAPYPTPSHPPQPSGLKLPSWTSACHKAPPTHPPACLIHLVAEPLAMWMWISFPLLLFQEGDWSLSISLSQSENSL